MRKGFFYQLFHHQRIGTGEPVSFRFTGHLSLLPDFITGDCQEEKKKTQALKFSHNNSEFYSSCNSVKISR
jgi:hypothetical protein